MTTDKPKPQVVVDTRPYELGLLRGAYDRETARIVATEATSNHFGHEDTSLVFKAFQRLHFAGMTVNHQTLHLELTSSGVMTRNDAENLLLSIEQLPPVANAKHLIAGLGKLRAQKQLGELTEYLQKPEAIKNGMNGALAKINEFVMSHHEVVGKKSETLVDSMQRAIERAGHDRVWTPGFGKLDNYWKIRKGSYTVIGGDSGSGKTSALVNMVLSIAKQNTHVGVISIEMSTDELTYRAAAIECGIPHERIEDNTLSDGERQIIFNYISANKELYERIHIVDPAFVSSEELHGLYNDFVSTYGCEVVFVDYIQRIGSKDKAVSSKIDTVSHASETLTAVTKATGVATIALSVLARDHNASKKGLDHLKHSGQIGHDAHTVVILTPEPTDGPPGEDKLIRIEAVKNRKGPFFTEMLVLNGPTQRITHAGFDIGYSTQDRQKQ